MLKGTTPVTVPKNRNFYNPTCSKNPANTIFHFTHNDSFLASDDEDTSFFLVDGKPPLHPKFGPKWRFQQQCKLPQDMERARWDRLYHMNCNGEATYLVLEALMERSLVPLTKTLGT